MLVFNFTCSTEQCCRAVCGNIHVCGTIRTFTYIDMEDRLDSLSDTHAGKTVFSFAGSSKAPDQFQVFLPTGIGQIATVTDPAEPFGEYMQQKAAHELFSIKKQRLFFPSVTVVFVSHRNTFGFYRDYPAV